AIVRPSIKSTIRRWSSTVTDMTRRSVSDTKECMPSLQKRLLMLAHHTQDLTHFFHRKANIAGNGNIMQPYLGGGTTVIYMYMRWLIRFMAIEVETKAILSQNSGHKSTPCW